MCLQTPSALLCTVAPLLCLHRPHLTASWLTVVAAAQVNPDALASLGLDPTLLTPSRTNGFLTLLQAMRKRAHALARTPDAAFPSLIISAHDTVPQGAFAEAQAAYLQPDLAAVQTLVQVCALLGSH